MLPRTGREITAPLCRAARTDYPAERAALCDTHTHTPRCLSLTLFSSLLFAPRPSLLLHPLLFLYSSLLASLQFHAHITAGPPHFVTLLSLPRSSSVRYFLSLLLTHSHTGLLRFRSSRLTTSLSPCRALLSVQSSVFHSAP